MSHFVKLNVQAQQRFEAELLAALEAHFGTGKVESHGDKKVDLITYEGKKSGLKANLVVRKQTQQEKLGWAAYTQDLGYERNKDGTYDLHCDQDGFPVEAQDWVSQRYAQLVAEHQLEAAGYSVAVSDLKNGEVQLVAQRWS